MKKRNLLFTINNIRGLRRFIDLRKNFISRGYSIELITSSFTLYLISKIFGIKTKFLMQKKFANYKDLKKISNYNKKLFLSSIKAEIDQEINYNYGKYLSRLFIFSKKIKSLHTYLNALYYLRKHQNTLILGYNSNIINQISICAASIDTNNDFYSLVPVNPPSIVGITKSLPFLRELVLRKDKFLKKSNIFKDNNYLSKKIPKAQLTSDLYLKNHEIFFRKVIYKILSIIDDLFNLYYALTIYNKSTINLVEEIFHEENYTFDSLTYWTTSKNNEKYNQEKIKFFDGNIKNKFRYHIFFCSSPFESENYFPGLNNEYSKLKELSQIYKNNGKEIVIARLHPGWEKKYSKLQLQNLSYEGIQIWDKTKCNNFALGNSHKIIKYTTCGTIFFESLGKESPCIVTSEAFKSIKTYLKQPNEFDKYEYEIYFQKWQKKSKELKEIIAQSCWIQDYYDPSMRHTKKQIDNIISILNL